MEQGGGNQNKKKKPMSFQLICIDHEKRPDAGHPPISFRVPPSYSNQLINGPLGCHFQLPILIIQSAISHLESPPITSHFHRLISIFN